MKGVGTAVVATKRVRRASGGDLTAGVSPSPASAVSAASAAPAAAKGRARPAERTRRATAPDVMNARPGARPIRRAEQPKRAQGGAQAPELIERVHRLTEALRVRAEEMKAFVRKEKENLNTQNLYLLKILKNTSIIWKSQSSSTNEDIRDLKLFQEVRETIQTNIRMRKKLQVALKKLRSSRDKGAVSEKA